MPGFSVFRPCSPVSVGLAALCLTPFPAAAQMQTIASLPAPMQTGIAVSASGRLFTNFPHWGDPVRFTVAEVKNGRVVPYPNAAINRLDKAHPSQCLVSMQSVVVAPNNRLWLLDTGSIKFTRVIPGGPKLVCVDLATNKIVKTISFPSDVALPMTYLNDIRFDLRRGKAGAAYITDSADQGPNAIIVVDLATGKSWRRLNAHPSTKAEPNFVARIHTETLMQRLPGNKPKPIKNGADGIALSADGKTLFYCALAGRHLYGVSTDALWDQSKTDAEVAQTVKNYGVKPPSDGMEFDAEGRIYLSDYENARVVRGRPGGPYQTVAQLPLGEWPDTLSIGAGALYISANQFQGQGAYHYGHYGHDRRRPPYHLYRVPLPIQPVALK